MSTVENIIYIILFIISMGLLAATIGLFVIMAKEIIADIRWKIEDKRLDRKIQEQIRRRN